MYEWPHSLTVSNNQQRRPKFLTNEGFLHSACFGRPCCVFNAAQCCEIMFSILSKIGLPNSLCFQHKLRLFRRILWRYDNKQATKTILRRIIDCHSVFYWTWLMQKLSKTLFRCTFWLARAALCVYLQERRKCDHHTVRWQFCHRI